MNMSSTLGSRPATPGGMAPVQPPDPDRAQASIRGDRLLAAMADPTRLRLLVLLEAAGESCVCHLVAALDLPQGTVSRHLGRLRRDGLVATRRAGQWVHYRLAEPSGPVHRHLVAVLPLIAADANADDAFATDAERLALAGAGECRP